MCSEDRVSLSDKERSGMQGPRSDDEVTYLELLGQAS
jgi:hypothetical protein